MKKLFFFILTTILYWEAIKAIFHYIRTASTLGVGGTWFALIGILMATFIALVSYLRIIYGNVRVRKVEE